jgi:hypothetical protein
MSLALRARPVFAALVVACAMMLAACAQQDAGPPSDPRDVIELRWVKAYPRESRSDVETGLLWGLSLAGATLPKGARVVGWRGDRITLDLARARVLDGTLPAWREFIAAMKDSGEYRTQGALDAGRFMAIMLGDPDRYYALTGATPDYQAARDRYHFDGRSAAIVRSGVALGSRRIDLSLADSAAQLAFVGFEGRGSFADGSFVAHEMELVDVMPNGQLRFALYDLEGRLKQGATRELTRAGKPAKCMWCHESGLMMSLVDYPAVSGFYDRHGFDALIGQRREMLSAYRRRLDTQIDYDERQDHTFAELLYLSFQEPSRQRLAREWNVSEERAAELLRATPTHAHGEFAFLGSELYHREDVEKLAPYTVMAAPQSVRELPAPKSQLVEARP